MRSSSPAAGSPRASSPPSGSPLYCAGGEYLDSFCTNFSDFIGCGTLEHPELIAHLPSRYSRKNTPFFAIEKTFNVANGAAAAVDEYVHEGS